LTRKPVASSLHRSDSSEDHPIMRSCCPLHLRAPKTAAAVLGAAWFLGIGIAPAHAEPATADNFRIRYFKTTPNADQDRTGEMSPDDLKWWANRARCECGQGLVAEVTVVGSPDQAQTRMFVGPECIQAETDTSSRYGECLKFFDAFLDRSTPVEETIETMWLAMGVADVNQRTLETATAPAGRGCTEEGTADLWICVEDGQQAGCDTSEFVVPGSSGAMMPPGTTTSGSYTAPGPISYDFRPPSIQITDIEEPVAGDGALVLRWGNPVMGDIAGFRVLCADENGAPLGRGFSLTDNQKNDLQLGEQVFMTREDLCPEGLFGNAPPPVDPSVPTDPTSTATDTSSSDPTDTDTAGTDASTGTGGSAGTGGSTDGGTTTDTGATADTGATTTGPGGNGESLPISWDYICSDHIAPTATSVRISGLTNGRTYKIMLVAYDQAGNPAPATSVLTGVPQETSDFWEQCERQGGICGDGGFCRVAPRPVSPTWLVLLALLGGFRRRNTRCRPA
jgi:hypothetical protein